MTSSFFCGPTRSTPRSSPNDETYPVALRASSGQVEVSLTCATSRKTANPIEPVDPPRKRNCENGTRNSACQPSGVRDTATSQTASQLRSLFVSLYQYVSTFTPAALTRNSYAVR